MTRKFQNKYRVDTIRLQSWDYRNNAAYFITICTQNRKHYFGDVVNGKMQLSTIGNLAHEYWNEIPHHFSFAKLDAFVVMPNHVHGIIVIDGNGGDRFVACNESTTNNKNQYMANISPKTGSLSTIVRSYKSQVTKMSRPINPNFAWQSRFWDHIIRNDASYQRIKQYIINNPKKWGEDKFKQEE
ncbi:transposase [Labilibacter marinus]|uniref:transposase n=1 Tax=Labilibacter marinus TaxID=1477105 RepID=UPI00094FA9DD|nr:transposase [Labilibacter marinus]